MQKPAHGKNKVLIVEDQASVRKMLSEYLKQNGYEVFEAWSVDGAARAIRMLMPDFVLLDLTLDDEDGLTLLRASQTSLHTIVISARGSADDRITALELGADDYLVKPIAPKELLIKLEKISGRTTAPANPDFVVPIADMKMNLLNNSILGPNGRSMRLTKSEFVLLGILIENRNQPCTKSDIAKQVLGKSYGADSRAVDVMASKLRKKLLFVGSTLILRSVRGVGYVAR
jgi:DNA-binding response OmpR family regulator